VTPAAVGFSLFISTYGVGEVGLVAPGKPGGRGRAADLAVVCSGWVS